MPTESKSPIAILYLDLGVCPAIYVVMKYKLIVLHYVLKQYEKSWLNRLLKAQLENPIKEDGVLEMKKLIVELKIAVFRIEIMKMKRTNY